MIKLSEWQLFEVVLEAKNPLAFSLTNGRDQYILIAKTENEKKNWILHLNKAIELAKENENEKKSLGAVIFFLIFFFFFFVDF